MNKSLIYLIYQLNFLCVMFNSLMVNMIVCAVFILAKELKDVNYYPFDQLHPLKTNQDYINFSSIGD